ncbi:ATP-binding cassette domain-containing protein [Labilibacter sediminis]|nr:ATP-binding cassette domain-containing protein [Labilibacter sediminis]
MEVLFKLDTIRQIVELFALFKHKEEDDFAILDKSYLEQYLVTRFSQKVQLELLDYYNDYKLKAPKNENPTETLYLNKTQSIVSNISSQLSKTQKTELYITLLDYVIDQEIIITKKEKLDRLLKQLNLIKTSFELPEDEMSCVSHFIRDDLEYANLSKSIVAVGNFTRIKLQSFHTLQRDDFKGKLFALYVCSMQSFLVKYVGSEELLLNNQIIFPERIYQLSAGGVIDGENITPLFFGDLNLIFQKKSTHYMEIEAIDISKSFNNSNQGIKPLSFEVSSGQLMAIMGGSGTGKTTLFNLLSGTLETDQGHIKINGFDLYENLDSLKQQIGVVPQDDLLIEDLTVFQNLLYSTQFCRNDLSKKQIIHLVNKTLAELGLLKIKHLKVGNPLDKIISGGQRKRLNIALEVVRKPGILFVDEPTSGLSSSDALIVVKVLKKIASQGNIVIINIHQPTSDVFFLFDKLLILDENGYSAYFGNPFTASSYFKKHLQLVDSAIDDNLRYGHYNPERIIDLMEYRDKSSKGEFINKRVLKNTEWHNILTNKTNKKKSIQTKKSQRKYSTKSNTYIPSLFKQFLIYFKRNVMIRMADKQYLLLVLFGAPLLSFVMAFFLKSTDYTTHKYLFINNDNIPAYLFISVVVALFLGLILSSSEIFRDLKVLKRESFLSLSPVSYLNSKVLFVAIVNAIQILCYVWVGNTILEIKGMFWDYFLTLWLTAVASSLIGLYISSKFKSILAIYITIPFLLIPQILLAGAILDFDKIHHSLASKKYVPFYADINISRWSYESLMVIQFTKNKYSTKVIDQLIEQSKLVYYNNFLIPKIETLLSQLNKEQSGETGTSNNIKLLIDNLITHFPEIKNEILKNEITPENVPKISQTIKKVKKWLKLKLNKVYDNVTGLRKENKDIKKELYYNQKLSEFILKSNDYQKFIYSDGEMIRKFQPGYYISDNQMGRSHYYAPYKRAGSLLIKTYHFNLIVISLFIILFYFTILISLKKRKF